MVYPLSRLARPLAKRINASLGMGLGRDQNTKKIP